MSPEDFMRWLQSYYGTWAVQAHKHPVWEWVRTATAPFLAGLRVQLEQTREPREGPVTLPILMRLAQRVRTETQPELAIEDGEQAVAVDMTTIMEKLKSKINQDRIEGRSGYSTLVRPKPFGHLNDIRHNAKVELMDEYYDEKMSMQERMENYAARYKGKHKRKEGGVS